MKGTSKRKPPIKSKDYKPPPNQKTLNQFWTSSQTPGQVPPPLGVCRTSNSSISGSLPASTSATAKKTISNVGRSRDTTKRQSQASSSKDDDDDVIVISDSDSESENPKTKYNKINDNGGQPVSSSNYGEMPLTEPLTTSMASAETVTEPEDVEDFNGPDSGIMKKPMELSPSSSTSTQVLTPPIMHQTQLSAANIEMKGESATSSTTTTTVDDVLLDPIASFGSDSDDDILSHLDMDEIISSQENSATKKSIELSQGSSSSRSSSQVSNPPIFNKTPTKVPKQKVNRFSVIKRINSRSPTRKGRNNSSASRSSSSSSSGKLSSVSPKTPKTPNQNGAALQSTGSVVKQLQFPDATKTFTPFEPYYLKHWTTVLDGVTCDPLNIPLLDDSDWEIIGKFRDLSFEAKCLFVRLFARKWDWKVASSIKYPLIKEDLTSVFHELHAAGFLVEIRDVQDQLELKIILKILNGEQIAALGKQMKVNSKKTKKDVTSSLLDLTKNKSVFATSTSVDHTIRKKAFQIIGCAYQVEGTCRALFSRMLIMHSPPQYWEDEQNQASNQIAKMFLTDDGTMLYPQYKINKTTALYKDRHDLIRFYEAWTSHCNITAHLESKNWEEVIKLGENAFSLLQQVLNDPDIQSIDQSLPTYLRIYKAGSVLTRILWLSIDGYQKLKQYETANQYIDLLLSQDLYLTQYRGRWYERLVINEKQHLKLSQEKRKGTCLRALEDKFLLDSHKLCISEKFEKLLEEIQKPPKKKSKKTKRNVEEDVDTDDETENQKFQTKQNGVELELLFRLNQDLPSRTIQGEKLLNPKSGKSVFVSEQDDHGSYEASSVELFAISHYKKHLGYNNGVHAEGAVVCSLFGLLFWDEIYSDEITDTFHSQYQSHPLDMNFDDFFIRREGIILDKLEGMRTSWIMGDALSLLETNWKKHQSELSLVNWNAVSEAELRMILKCLGLRLTAAICERLARNYRHWRSGFPDLVLWNDNDAIFVEVKGPGDTLSNKQKVWLDFLLSIGAKAEVCHVQAVSNKKIKTRR